MSPHLSPIPLVVVSAIVNDPNSMARVPTFRQELTDNLEDTVYGNRSVPLNYAMPMPYLRAIHKSSGKKGRQLLSYLGNQPIADAQALYPSLYDKAFGQMYKKANLALTLWEANKSLAMIRSRALLLFRAARALRRYRFFEFANLLGIRGYHPPSRSRVKRITESGGDVSGIWLEYTFGWKPLIQDIYAAINVLQQDFGFDAFRVSRRVSNNLVKSQANGVPWDNSYSVATHSFAYLGGRVRVSNPNLFLANQLGLTNPAAVAYDAIPFSFVLDWFIPVQKFLASFQNEFGLELDRLYFGYGYKAHGFYTFRKFPDGSVDEAGPGSSFWMNRTTPSYLPIPSILSRLRVPDATPWLAITSVSLLTQQLNGLLGQDGRFKNR